MRPPSSTDSLGNAPQVGVAGEVVLLDGPMGTELMARGVAAPAPLWSAWAVVHAPGEVTAVHRDYGAAGATVHTATTFRANRRAVGAGWEGVARRAVELARSAIPVGHRVAGSIAPLEDCYRPDLSPPRPGGEHRELARVLVDAGVDLLLCETFAHPDEAVAAVEAAVATGVETWVALTAGPGGNLLDVPTMVATAARCVRAGAQACLVNCVPAAESARYLLGLRTLPVPVGVYANAGRPSDRIGWGQGGHGAAERYAGYADGWIEAGATIVGGCCGTGPAHVAAVAGRLACRRRRP